MSTIKSKILRGELSLHKAKRKSFSLVEQLQIQRIRKDKGNIQEWFKMKQKLQKQFLPSKNMQAINKNYSCRPRMIREMQQLVFFFFFFFNVASDSSKAANTCKEEGIALFLNNTFLASKEEEEEVSDSILPIENN